MSAKAIRHFLDLRELDAATLRMLIENAKVCKHARATGTDAAYRSALQGQTLAMVFEKNSTRTRVSFEVGMMELGGHALYLPSTSSQLGRGETPADTARVLSRYVQAIMVRTCAHSNIEEIAAHASVPVINGLTDLSHPCQIMADILTYEEHRGSIEGAHIAWVGDGNNVANSWIAAAVAFGVKLHLACPAGFRPAVEYLEYARAHHAEVVLHEHPADAVRGAHAVITDTWVSMGDNDADTRHAALANYQVNQSLMQLAAKDALFMHCLPAHRGEEVSAEVIDGDQSVVWDEAENRLHVQKAILLWCLQR